MQGLAINIHCLTEQNGTRTSLLEVKNSAMQGEPGRYRSRAAAVCPLPSCDAKPPPMLPPRPVPSPLPPHCLLLPLSAAACDLRQDAAAREVAQPPVEQALPSTDLPSVCLTPAVM